MIPSSHLSDYLHTIDLSPVEAVILNELKFGHSGFPFHVLVERFENDFQNEDFRVQLYSDVGIPKKVGAAEIRGAINKLLEKKFLIQFTPETLCFLNFLFASPQLNPFQPEVVIGNIGISWLGYVTTNHLRAFLKPKCRYVDCETRVLSDENWLYYYSATPQLIRDELEYYEFKEEPMIEKCGPWVCSCWWDVRPAGYRCKIPLPQD